ncbi:hypothetical protein [Candidatus Villigracilis affinis]|uniref:hypothetical protein n=1 Tax=Candidatus Villigracilis affinis TaxID=3140682 RepID=UPI002A1DFF2C|nr:hypothetical protein [Anaerolineales bacterium]
MLKNQIKLGAGQAQALFEFLTAQKNLLESISRTIANLAGSDESQSPPQSLQYRPKVIVGQFL